MTYELAKQLKDVGFPQPERGQYGDFRDENDIAQDGSYGGKYIYFPTLSELITACKSPIFVLTKQSEWHGGGWVAGGGTDMPKELSMSEMERVYKEGKGSSLEEAVAKLWLALNVK